MTLWREQEDAGLTACRQGGDEQQWAKVRSGLTGGRQLQLSSSEMVRKTIWEITGQTISLCSLGKRCSKHVCEHVKAKVTGNSQQVPEESWAKDASRNIRGQLYGVKW